MDRVARVYRKFCRLNENLYHQNKYIYILFYYYGDDNYNKV